MITMYLMYAGALLAICAVAFGLLELVMAKQQIAGLLEELAHTSNTNPWNSQLALMFKSGQQLPTSPSCTKGSMLYGALIIEEAAETLAGLSKAVEEVSLGRGSDAYGISIDLLHISKVMAGSAVAIRGHIAASKDTLQQRTISKEVAREILDGITDLHVVTAGLGLACGLPGQAGYERVATSNLSKANPVSGIIDKDASGKWIKGVDYKEPDLDSLLDPFYRFGA